MTNDFTPTTEHVRAQYARQENCDQYYEGDLFGTPDGQISAAQFDRWLAKRDKQIIANVNSVKCGVEQVDGSCTAARHADASGWEQRVGPKGDSYWACPECIAWLASVNAETVGSAS